MNRLFLGALAFVLAVSAGAQSVVDVEYSRTISLSGKSEVRLKLDVYLLPMRSRERIPVVVLCHGGSYVTGNKRDVAPFARALENEGLAVVAIDYRLGFVPDVRTERASPKPAGRWPTFTDHAAHGAPSLSSMRWITAGKGLGCLD